MDFFVKNYTPKTTFVNQRECAHQSRCWLTTFSHTVSASICTFVFLFYFVLSFMGEGFSDIYNIEWQILVKLTLMLLINVWVWSLNWWGFRWSGACGCSARLWFRWAALLAILHVCILMYAALWLYMCILVAWSYIMPIVRFSHTLCWSIPIRGKVKAGVPPRGIPSFFVCFWAVFC